jgi:lipopolysaccharide/colanic/teichoic acid biosynthesis glycosyltransferase
MRFAVQVNDLIRSTKMADARFSDNQRPDRWANEVEYIVVAANSAKVAPATSVSDSAMYAVPVDRVPPRGHWLVEALYRVLEIAITFIALLLSLPIMLIEGLLIRIGSSGPALFRQPRTAQSLIVKGRDLSHFPEVRVPEERFDEEALYYVPRTFPFIKFRTMYNDARERFPELYDYSFKNEAFRESYTKRQGDPRVTRLGRILRRLTIDELPNLWCVLIGEMRLVGPRPELPETLPSYAPEEMYKFSVKPGITGLAQINGRGLLSRGETVEWDLKYVRSRTVWLDIKIIFKTLWLVVMRHGAF